MPEKDSILREQYYIISNLWKSAINIRKIHDKVNLKDWAYQYSVNVFQQMNAIRLQPQTSVGLRSCAICKDPSIRRELQVRTVCGQCRP